MRIILMALAVGLLSTAPTTHAQNPATIVAVLPAGKQKFLVKIEQSIPGPTGWQKHVEILVPRDRDLILPKHIVTYQSRTSFNNGDSAEMLSPPTYGFVLFGSDREGPTVEIRLLELFDKRDFVASSINGVYHFTYPSN